MDENEIKSDKENFIEGFKVAKATYILVALNILMFAFLELHGGSLNSQVMLRYGAMNTYMIVEYGQWYRLFTAMFMHFGIEHLLNNMLLLFFVGQMFEKAVGSLRFLVIYLGAGLAGGLVSFSYQYLTGRSDIVAGASGAVFGIVGGMIIVVLTHKGHYEGISMKRMLLMAALALYFGFATAGTDNAGHIGGIISGIILSILLYAIPEIIRSKPAGFH